MGAVFMAEQEHPIRRRVALKIIKPGMDSEQVIARFEVERQALALMDHPNIARVLDAGTTAAGRPYFVMELVKGVPITDYCDQNRLDPKQRLELFLPVCQAIQHAHQKGVIHRDVKPSNILVTLHDGKPVPKVIDFGIGRAIDQRLTERTLFTQFGAIIGTPEYMSPEQAGMGGLDVDTRSDIYSLGVLLYELLTGSTPLRRETLRQAAFNEMLRRIKEEEPPKPSTRIQTTEELPSIAASRHTEPVQLAKLVRGELDWIVMKCLEKDRTRRYEAPSGLARDLDCYLHDEPVEAGPPSASYKLKKYALKHRAGLATAVAFASVLLLATATSIWLAYSATRARNEARIASELSKINEAKAKEQEFLAEKSAAESRAVLRFFQENVLAAARPKGLDGGLGKDVTIRQAVEAAEPQITEAFQDQPETEASIRDALGTTYHYLGENQRAIDQLEHSRQIRTRALGADDPDTLTSMNNLGMVLGDAGRPEMALPLLQETLELRKVKLGSDHEDTIGTMENLANLYHRSERFPEAIALHTTVLELRKKSLGPTHPDTLLTGNNLAMDFQAAGRYAEALPLLSETLKLRRAALGSDHPYTIGSMDNLANLYHRTKRLAEAIALHTEVLELRRTRLGLDHPDTPSDHEQPG
jgi:serine/threonine protein kinase